MQMSVRETGVSEPTSALDNQVTGLRVLAFLLDGVTVLVATPFFVGLLGFSSSTSLLLLAPLLYAVEAIFIQGITGWTLGKKALGIKVVRADTGHAPGIGKAFFRTLLLLIDGLFSGLVGFLVVLLSGENQRLGDMAAHTQVVRANSSPHVR